MNTKSIAQVLGWVTGIAAGIYAGVYFVLWLFTFVPDGPYATLIKIGIGFVSFWTFAGIVIFASILLGGFLGWLFAVIVELAQD
jgi:hypothetical protein